MTVKTSIFEHIWRHHWTQGHVFNINTNFQLSNYKTAKKKSRWRQKPLMTAKPLQLIIWKCHHTAKPLQFIIWKCHHL